MIFVFGSNEAGRHGAGAAKFALQRKGAIYGIGVGHHGQSYAIPTKDHNIITLPYADIEKYVKQFLEYAKNNPQLQFQVTRIGCGLAGFTDNEIAPLFVTASDNCYFDSAWSPYLPDNFKFWGSI
ncbi:hypothetical protein MIJ3_00375 [Pseudomonas phage vB_PaeM_MIJ3]|nr:hypothetical protein MIJ3_00375 [Pseudomonas phage vB_PaeM_MIJ3]